MFAILGTVMSLLIGSRVADFSSIMLPLAAGGFIYRRFRLGAGAEQGVDPWQIVVQLLAIGVGVGLMLLLDMLED